MTISGTTTGLREPRGRRFAPPLAISVKTRRWPPPQVGTLLVAMILPWAFSIGSLALSAYRVVLLALIVPTAVYWLAGRAGKIRAVDILLCLFCIWSTVAVAVVHGADQALQPSGILIIETLGPYLVARCFIRSAEDFRAMVRLLAVLVVAMLPLALAEAVTGQRLILHLFRMLLPTIADGSAAPRWGLTRVQGPFEHPILFGVFCGSATAMTYLVLGQGVGLFRRWAMTAAVVATGLLSLSSGPIVAILAQLGLLAWNDVLGRVKARWRILWVLAIAVYVVLDIASNQPVFQLLTRYAFDPWTAYYRLLIFQFGWASVMAHPLFGTGFNEWLHPAWMTSSIDMFWIVPAVRYGLPAALLFMLAFLLAVAGVAFRSGRTPEASLCCTAYLITMTGFFLVGWTVHFWMATYVLFMFLLGSGMWLLEPAPAAAAEGEPVRAGRAPAVRRPVPQRRRIPGPAVRVARLTRKGI